jgi:hypothetical protein
MPANIFTPRGLIGKKYFLIGYSTTVKPSVRVAPGMVVAVKNSTGTIAPIYNLTSTTWKWLQLTSVRPG